MDLDGYVLVYSVTSMKRFQSCGPRVWHVRVLMLIYVFHAFCFSFLSLAHTHLSSFDVVKIIYEKILNLTGTRS